MKIFSFFVSLLLCLVALAPAQAFVAPAQVQVETPQWGDASSADVEAVLRSVIEVITPYMANRQFGRVVVKNDGTGPISLYERGENGEYIIMLDVQGRYWSQLAYQFSHEMCHLMTNYDLSPNNTSRQQWFEEALCEAFSLFTLDKMAEQWREAAPYPNWQDYAPKFAEYKHNNLREKHRKLPPGMKLPQWYQQYRSILSNDPYAKDRNLNELVANQLLPLFDSDPQNWIAINYLNLGDDSSDKSLNKYLSDWQENTPADLAQVVVEIRQILLKKGK